MIFLTIALGLALFYMAIQFQYLYYWDQIKPLPVPPEFTPSTGITVIVVARNEADVIVACLQGLLSQSYPSTLFEIIVIDDHSTDITVAKILPLQNQNLQLLLLQDFPGYIQVPAYKKSAITLGVEKARHELILVSDADCIYPMEWMKTIAFHFEKSGACFQTAPVLLFQGRSLLEQMQEVEMLVYMLITGAGIRSRLHDMANGANMAFTKAAFRAVHGYEGNFQYASGDDLFLAEKMGKMFPKKIHFAKSIEATVLTKGKANWSDLLKQRRRWASKNKGLKNKSVSLVWFFIGLYHFFLLLFFILTIFHITRWGPFLVMLILKWVADYFVLQSAADFFNRSSLLRNFIPMQLLFSWYILRLSAYMIMGKKADWKR